MNNLESVKFQSEESKFNFMDSACVNIKIPEIGISLEPSTQNVKNMRNYNENLKSGRKTNGLKLALCCLAFVFVMILLSGLIYLGFRKQEDGEGVKSSRGPIFGQRNSTHSASSHNFQAQTRTEAQEHENPIPIPNPNLNPDAETSETESEPVDIAALLKTLSEDIDALVSEKAKEVTSKISGEISQLRYDLKGQIAIIGQNRSREVNFNAMGDELKKEISSLKDQIKTMTEWLNFTSHATAPPLLTTMKTTTAPPTKTTNLTAPRFYRWPEYKAPWFEPASGWESKCVNLPSLLDQWSESVDLGGHCLFVCPGKDCRKKTNGDGTLYLKECIELGPNSKGLKNFAEINYKYMFRSFRLCQKI